MHIVIIEGGLGGLVLAYLLQKKNHHVTMFHRDATLLTPFYSVSAGSYHYELGFFAFLASEKHLLKLSQELEIANFLQTFRPSFGFLRKGKLSLFAPPLHVPPNQLLTWALFFLRHSLRQPQSSPYPDLFHPYFGKAPSSEQLYAFLKKPHYTFRYGMSTLVERLIARGNFLLECAEVHFKKNREKKIIESLFVRSPQAEKASEIKADLFILGKSYSFPYPILGATTTTSLPYDHIFVMEKGELQGMISKLNNYFPHWQVEKSVLRFSLCLRNYPAAMQIIEKWAEMLHLAPLTDYKTAPFYFSSPSLYLEAGYENMLYLPEAATVEEEIQTAYTLSQALAE